jgi:hypothetical protein
LVALVALALQALSILYSVAAVVVAEVNPPRPARVAQAGEERVLPITLTTGPMEPQILVVAEAEAQTVRLHQLPVKMAALVLLFLGILPH